jgi:hypothetical protein
MRRFSCAFLIIGMATAHLNAADADLKVKVEKKTPPAELNDAIKQLLGDDALQVTDSKGVVCTIWFRKEIPAKATADQIKNGLTYREIPRTSLIGAIELPQKWTDFRKQEIPKGVYTLRIAVQPMDGDHMGTAPHNDFCLLSPAAKDEKSDPMEMKALNDLSAQSTAGTHPSVLLLFPNSKPQDEPKIENKGNGIWVVNVKRAVAAGNEKASLGFGFTVAGHTAE